MMCIKQLLRLRIRIRIQINCILILYFGCQLVLLRASVIKQDVSNSISKFRANYASLMLSYMNETAKPCDDFYEYACGNFKNVVTERLTDKKRNNFFDIKFTILDRIKSIIEERSPPNQYKSEFKIMANVYDDCLAAELHPTKANPSYVQVLKSIGGFPAIDATWTAQNFSWFNMSVHLLNYGALGLIQEKIYSIYPFDPYYEMPQLGFDYNVHSSNVAAKGTYGYKLNYERMSHYLKIYGVEKSKADKVIQNIYEFWKQVLKIADEYDENLDKCMEMHVKEKGTYAEWKNLYELAWENKNLSAEFSICPCDQFYIQLDQIYKKQPETVANYLAMKFLYAMDPKLKKKQEQTDFCLLTISSAFKSLLNELYMQKYFNDDIRKAVMDTVQQVKKNVRTILSEADWLDDETRAEALKKESTIGTVLGRHEDKQLTTKLIQAISKLKLDKQGTFVDNIVNLNQFATYMLRFNGLNREQLPNTTQDLVLITGMDPNAFYYIVDNNVYLMAATFQPPLYHKDWPSALKFGALGYAAGHEFTHAFDTVGSLRDSTGAPRNWWSETAMEKFKTRADCFVKHFNNYVVPETKRNIDGNLTRNENIADSGGLRSAFMAHKNHLKQLSDKDIADEKMPGIDLTPQQLFFLGFAQLWCSSYKEEHYWQELTDTHPVDKYRVIGALSNNEHFMETFKCPVGSQMNPKAEKCRVW